MKLYTKLFILFFALFLFSNYSIKKMDYREGRMKNVCKNLGGEVLVYFMFVDSKETYPWTQYDIQSTIDSMEVAARWIEKKAHENNIQLKIRLDYYIGNDYATIKKNLPMGTVEETIFEPNFKKGLNSLNDWANSVAKRAGSSFEIKEKDGIPEIKNPRDKERLVSLLRDENQLESVALLYMVNNYFKEDISLPVNIYNTKDVEFAVVSYKYPAVIAHNILHLFGAADLYETPYRRHPQKLKIIEETFNSEIMQDAYGKNIESLTISDYTKYLIGWIDREPKKYSELFTDKIINF
jgi:hypothetical protein